MFKKLIAQVRRIGAGVRASTPSDTAELFDLDLRVSRYQQLEDGHQRIVLRTEVRGRLVGFSVELHPEWRADLLNGTIPVFWGRVTFYSIGPESDALVQALVHGYGKRAGAERMLRSVPFTAIALRGEPSKAAEQSVRMKLFFAPEDPDAYAEVYTNLDVRAGTGELHEKDTGYRERLLAAFTRSS